MTEKLKRGARLEETMSIRMTPELLAASELVAALTCRSRSSLIQYALTLYIAKNYPSALNPRAKLSLLLDEAPIEGKNYD